MALKWCVLEAQLNEAEYYGSCLRDPMEPSLSNERKPRMSKEVYRWKDNTDIIVEMLEQIVYHLYVNKHNNK